MRELVNMIVNDEEKGVLEYFKRNDINKDILGITPLMLASYWGNIKIVKMLVELGVGINNTDRNNLNALMYACLEVPALFLKRFHILTNSEDIRVLNNSESRLDVVEYLLHIKSCTTFLSKKFRVIDTCNYLESATPLDIYMANSYIDDLNIINLLLNNKTSINYEPDYFYKKLIDNSSSFDNIPQKRVLKKKAKYLEKIL